MAKAIYLGGADGTALNVKNLYIGVDGVAQKVVKGYVGVDGVAQLFYTQEQESGPVELNLFAYEPFEVDDLYLDLNKSYTVPKNSTIKITREVITCEYDDMSGGFSPPSRP